jgi:hypothetical protein
MTRFTGAHYRALALLDSCQDGCTEAMMLAHGHPIETIVDLIRADLASVQTEHRGCGTPIEVARFKINAKGRLARHMPRAKKVSRQSAVKAALRRYPQLTREEAEQITFAFGFR